LVSSGKEYKDGDRRDLRQSRFIDAKQSESKAKIYLQSGEWTGSRRSTALEVTRPQAFIEVCGHGTVQSWKTGLMCDLLVETGLCVINSFHMSSNILGFGWSAGAVILDRL
jgi:hypothetical protein